MEKVPLFCYTTSQVAEGVVCSIKENSFEKSKFDEVLCQHWDQAMANGLFRYDLSGVVTRRVAGRFGFIVQRNSKRGTHRRAPGKMLSLQQPFDPTAFNFNLIDPKEVVLQLCPEGMAIAKDDTNHLVIVNVSPITYGHTLLVPSSKSCLPQVLTEASIRLCLDMVSLSRHSGFSIVANSLLAYASVNHLHYHTLYVQEPVLAATVEGRHIAGGVYALSNHPSPGFGFQVLDSTAHSAREIFGVVSVLLQCNTPHNMVILRGNPFSEAQPSSQVLRAILIPRKPHQGCKVFDSEAPPLNAAACELAQGFIPVLDDSKYETLTEDEILEILREKIISESEFQSLLEKVVALYSTNTT